MKAVAYCRVSTNKDEQLDSLESQQRFFLEYAVKQGYELVHIYADEGKSGTKMKNRPQLLKMLSDARYGSFELVMIKDVSRLARNTLDFLTSIRKLKALGIKVSFVNYDQTSSDSSEFMLTMLSAIAQEESANTSKRVKFGKRQNAEHGRVPNLIYGYDKIPGDYFNLNINEQEATIVKRIFTMYTIENMGTNRIAKVLNQEGIKTKRGCCWTQNGIVRILSNDIYKGRIVNGRQEIEDFLTGKRRNTKQDQWLVSERPDLSLVNDEAFERAQAILARRKDSFEKTGKRSSDKHVLSQLLICRHCGASFRRLTRTYKNTYVNWVCNGHNSNGADFCENATAVDEKEILNCLEKYFEAVLTSKPSIVQNIIKEYNHKYKAQDEIQIIEKDYASKLNKLRKDKMKFMEMYTNDIITIVELKEKTQDINKEIERYKQELALYHNYDNSDDTISVRKEDIKDIKSILKPENFTNGMLKSLIRTISVDKDGNVDVYFALLSENV
jgi:DNA invertase Pin-like site-specific DNA recombinase